MSRYEAMKPILFNTEMVRAFLDNRKTMTRRVVKPQPADTDDCQHEMQTYDQMLPQFYKGNYSCVCRKCGYGTQPNGKSAFQPPYLPGDILYVPERWKCSPDSQLWANEEYRVVFPDGEMVRFYFEDQERTEKWRKYIDKPLSNWQSPYFMPREAARIFLRVTDVRAERLQDITAAGAIAEGAYWEDVTPNIPSVPDNPAFDMDAVIAEMQEREERELIEKIYGVLWNSTIKPKDRALYGWDANPWVWVIEFERISREEALSCPPTT